MLLNIEKSEEKSRETSLSKNKFARNIVINLRCLKANLKCITITKSRERSFNHHLLKIVGTRKWTTGPVRSGVRVSMRINEQSRLNGRKNWFSTSNEVLCIEVERRPNVPIQDTLGFYKLPPVDSRHSLSDRSLVGRQEWKLKYSGATKAVIKF